MPNHGPATPTVSSGRTGTDGFARIRFGTPIDSTSKTVEELQVGSTPSTPEEHRQFDDGGCPITREEIRKLRKLIKETRISHNELIQKQAQDMEDIRTMLRIAQRAEVTTRDKLEEQRGATTSIMATHDNRIHVMEVGFQELNEWAGRITEQANPEELWGNLFDQY